MYRGCGRHPRPPAGADAASSLVRKTAEIAAEAATDGVRVIRISLPAETSDDATAVLSYKSHALAGSCPEEWCRSEAEHWGGPIRTSDEGAVMGPERRGRVRWLHHRATGDRRTR
jgi:SH3-like domain-containing protein